MKDELKIEILEFWLNQPNKRRQIPEKLKKKVTDKDVVNLVREIGGLSISEIFNHLEKIRKKVHEKQILELQKNSIEIQNKVRKTEERVTISQWIMAFAMIITVFINWRSYDIQQKTYSIQMESLTPQIKLLLDCSPISVNGIINITPTIFNYGETGDYVYGELYSEGIILGDLRISGIPYQGDYKEYKPITIAGRFVEKNKPDKLPIHLDVTNATNDFRIIFKFWCKGEFKPCKFLGSNELYCEYHFNGTHYIYQQTCYIQS